MKTQQIIRYTLMMVSFCLLSAMLGYHRGATHTRASLTRANYEYAYHIGNNALVQAEALQDGDWEKALTLAESMMWNAILPTHDLTLRDDQATTSYQRLLSNLSAYFDNHSEPENAYLDREGKVGPHATHQERRLVLEDYRFPAPI